MKKSYDEPMFLLFKLCVADGICELSSIPIDGELGDYEDGNLTPDGDDL